MQLFYTPNIQADFFVLDEIESRHCAKVLRHIEGDIIYLIDGKGGFYKAEITESHPKHCAVRVVEKTVDFGKRNYSLEMACAPTKSNERFEWFLEKATEIGIDAITPIICQYSERKVIKPARYEKIIQSAAKQSIKAYVPALKETVSFLNFIKKPFDGTKYIAHCYESPKSLLKNAIKPNENVLILIGPEGDFSQNEVKMAVEHGFSEISLGDGRLRTETAAVVACHTVSLINQN